MTSFQAIGLKEHLWYLPRAIRLIFTKPIYLSLTLSLSLTPSLILSHSLCHCLSLLVLLSLSLSLSLSHRVSLGLSAFLSVCVPLFYSNALFPSLLSWIRALNDLNLSSNLWPLCGSQGMKMRWCRLAKKTYRRRHRRWRLHRRWHRQRCRQRRERWRLEKRDGLTFKEKNWNWTRGRSHRE